MAEAFKPAAPVETRRVSTTNNNLPMMLKDIESKKTPEEGGCCLFDHLATLFDLAKKEALVRGATEQQLEPVTDLFNDLKKHGEAFGKAVASNGLQP